MPYEVYIETPITLCAEPENECHILQSIWVDGVDILLNYPPDEPCKVPIGACFDMEIFCNTNDGEVVDVHFEFTLVEKCEPEEDNMPVLWIM